MRLQKERTIESAGGTSAVLTCRARGTPCSHRHFQTIPKQRACQSVQREPRSPPRRHPSQMPYAMEFPHFDAFFGRTSDLKIFLWAGCPRAGSAATPTFRARPCPAKRHGGQRNGTGGSSCTRSAARESSRRWNRWFPGGDAEETAALLHEERPGILVMLGSGPGGY